ncbi:MAG: M18 family aminopeptidase [Mycobacteriales bacterium]
MSLTAEQAGADLRAFVDASPSPFHAVAEMTRRLEQAGFTELSERDRWTLASGDARYVVRDGGSLIAFRVGSAPTAEAGIRLVGTHTDSPTFKLRPRYEVRRAGFRLLGVETYGGLLAHTWLDRELTVAGRIAVRGVEGGVEMHRVVLPNGPVRLPSLAIHLDRAVREGLQLDPQNQLVPIWGADRGGEPGLVEALADSAGIDAADVLGHDLVLADTQPSASTGADGSWIAAPRLDNLGSCHSAVLALLAAAPAAHTQLVVANDHEEVGSGSAEGARGPFLEDVVARVVAATSDRVPEGRRPYDPQDLQVTLARSRLVSADMAHAQHPNHAERHEPAHTPVLGGGPVLKLNANQSYATDARSGGWFAARCADAGVPLQHFVSRNDLPCGSTIGPLTATRLGLSTLDVGAPLLGMHSCRELGSAQDVPLMVRALTACLELG